LTFGLKRLQYYASLPLIINTHTHIAKELNVTSVVDKIQDCIRNWIRHVNRMPLNRLPSVIKRAHTKRQEETGKTSERTSGCVRREGVNKWPNCMIAT
jgi:hypothetical protein